MSYVLIYSLRDAREESLSLSRLSLRFYLTLALIARECLLLDCLLPGVRGGGGSSCYFTPTAP